jgi:hypothetical protein
MSSKERRKYHSTHRIHRRPRDWLRCFQEGWLDGEKPGLRRRRVNFQAVR